MNWPKSISVCFMICLPLLTAFVSSSVCAQGFDDEQEVEKVVAAAKSIGLEGKWIVLSVEKNAELSKAQIGQQPNDVISIVRGENNRGPLSFG